MDRRRSRYPPKPVSHGCQAPKLIVVDALFSKTLTTSRSLVVATRPTCRHYDPSLEVEANLCRQRTRCYVMRAAERGEEVVDGVLVGDVDRREPSAPLVAITAEEVVVPDRHIEQAATGDTRRIAVVVLSSRRGYLQFCRTIERCGAERIGADGRGGSCVNRAAEKACLKLLVWRQDRGVD